MSGESTFKEFPVDLRGHRVYTKDMLQEDGTLMAKFVDWNIIEEEMWTCVEHSMGSSCGNCGDYVALHLNYDKVARPSTACHWAPQVVETLLEVPSGKIVFGDYLPEYRVDIDEPRFASYNSSLGQCQVVKAYEEIGAAYGPVGNSCPAIYELVDGSYIIASPAYDEEKDDVVEPMHWMCMGTICTDLWAYTLADYDDWLAKGGNEEKIDGFLVVEPGTYKFTYLRWSDSFPQGDDSYSANEIFARFTKIG
jgi:hypothetical protein